MIKWLSSPEIKITNWRQFRGQLTRKPLKNGLKEVANLWKNCPKSQKPIFDISDVDAWPDPWQLLSQQYYCESSQTLGIYYTLTLIEDFNDLDIFVEVFEIAGGNVQSRVRINDYAIDLNSKSLVTTNSENLKIVAKLSKQIE